MHFNTFRVYLKTIKSETRYTSIIKTEILLISNYNWGNHDGIVKLLLSAFFSKKFNELKIENFNQNPPQIFADTRSTKQNWLYKYGFDQSREQFYLDFVFTGEGATCKVIIDEFMYGVIYGIIPYNSLNINRDDYMLF